MNHILEMKAHSETHFENENMFLEKIKVINAIGKKYKERFKNVCLHQIQLIDNL